MNNPFDLQAQEYDTWFDRFPLVFQAELAAVGELLRRPLGQAVEIGVGTGRFAAALGIPLGVELSLAMAVRAQGRGVAVIQGTAEQLPLADSSFDTVLIVTVLCFVAKPWLALQEATRILMPGGRLVLAVLDPDSPGGRQLEASKAQSRFFQEAQFLRIPWLLSCLKDLGLGNIATCQTIFRDIAAITTLEPVRPGWGQGLFVVLAGDKQ